MNDRRAPYKSYRQAMVTALDPKALQRWKLIILRGDSDFLLTTTRQQLRKVWQDHGWSVERIEGVALHAERFLQSIAAQSLFEPKTLTIIHEAQQCVEMLQHLQSVKESKEIQNPIVFLWRGKDIPAKLNKEMERLNALHVPCDQPAPWEHRDFVLDRCRFHSLPLTADAVDLILEAIGFDLFKLDNELYRLSLTLVPQQQPRNAKELHPFLSYLREDHVFKLDQLLCSDALAKALLLIKDLLNRGEKPLTLLAILALHCRKALQIQSGLKDGASLPDLARQLRLPLNVVQGYVGYVKKRKTSSFQRALALCHEADRRLKSRREGDEAWLSLILFELRNPSPI